MVVGSGCKTTLLSIRISAAVFINVTVYPPTLQFVTTVEPRGHAIVSVLSGCPY